MDIDVDIHPDVNPEELFNVIPASMVENGILKKHNVGYYFQNIPVHEDTGLSAITYKNSENFDFFKIDMIHVNLLKEFDSKEHLRRLMFKEPEWNLLLEREIVEQLFHIHKSFPVVYEIKPTSVLELADCLAIIRPNKIRLLDSYIRSKDRDIIRAELYNKTAPSDLRKSHAIPYAYLIIAQLNLLEERSNEIV